ncbi:MAG: hypothetical protein HZA03_06370 [Nitrospinae bacterium]|nr:hypothetical protein [Nitrospinota bacterium]
MQSIDGHLYPTRPMEGIDAYGNTPIADGPKKPSIPFREWRQRFGKAMDILKMRVKVKLNPENGKAVYETAPEKAAPQGIQNDHGTTKITAFRSGGNFKGALFNDVG